MFSDLNWFPLHPALVFQCIESQTQLVGKCKQIWSTVIDALSAGGGVLQSFHIESTHRGDSSCNCSDWVQLQHRCNCLSRIRGREERGMMGWLSSTSSSSLLPLLSSFSFSESEGGREERAMMGWLLHKINQTERIWIARSAAAIIESCVRFRVTLRISQHIWGSFWPEKRIWRWLPIQASKSQGSVPVQNSAEHVWKGRKVAHLCFIWIISKYFQC